MTHPISSPAKPRARAPQHRRLAIAELTILLFLAVLPPLSLWAPAVMSAAPAVTTA